MARASDLPATRLRRAPARARRHGRRQRRACRGDRAGGSRGRPAGHRAGLRARGDGAARRRRAGRGPGSVHDRGRRRQQPLRAGARDVPHPGVALRHGDPHLLELTEARRAVDRVGARRQGPQRQPDAGVRLDLPGRRRHGEHRRRAAVDVPRLQERQHVPPARRLRPPDRRPLADRRRPAGGASGERADPDGRIGRAEGRADLPRGRRRRRERQPVQRRGHRLRLRDGADGRRRPPRGAHRRRRHGAAALPEAARRRPTGSTSRSPGCSPG